jgi:hypothetical protein
LFTQRVAPGAHTPTQAPLWHACATQAAGTPQLPLALQVATALPSQRVAFGAQPPTQAPATHA